MNKDMFIFYRNALANNLCDQYKSEWNRRMKDKVGLYEFSLWSGSVTYLANATYHGWGITKELIHGEFENYINGKYVVDNLDDVEGATATSYYDYEFKGDRIDNSLVAIYWSKGLIDVKDYGCSHFHISNNSRISFTKGKNVMLWISVYDDSVVDIGNVNDGDIINVVKYSDTCIINYKENGGKIRIRKRDVDKDSF